MRIASYQFTMPYSPEDSAAVLKRAARNCGAKLKDLGVGSFEFGISPWSGAVRIKHTTFISEVKGVTTVRIRASGTETKSLYPQVWNTFLVALEAISSKELPIISGTPFIVRTTQIGGGIQSESTDSGFSAAGAITGGLLFGEVGAVVGGYSGSKRTTKDVLSDRALFLVQYSNGLIEELEVKKNSKLYAEIIAKLGADFAIPSSVRQQITASRMTNAVGQATAKKIPIVLQILCAVIIAISFFLSVLIFLAVS